MQDLMKTITTLTQSWKNSWCAWLDLIPSLTTTYDSHMMAIMKLSMKKKLIKLYSMQNVNNILSFVQNVLGMAPLSGKLPSNIAHSVSKPDFPPKVKER